MDTIAILGAGDLGAAIARRIAQRELARRAILVDSDEGKAKGKALDILQSGPVEGYDTRIEGCAALAAAGVADAVIVADPPEVAGPLSALRAGDLARELIPLVGHSLLLLAGHAAPALVEAVVSRGFPRQRALGTAPLALVAAFRRRLAVELDADPEAVSATLLGWPPEHVAMPQGTALLGGVPIDRLSATAARRALEAVRKRTLGPVALAAAAVRVLHALMESRGAVLPVVALLDGEYGHRGVALAVPARIGRGLLQSVVEFPLDPIDRVALDTAAQRRFDSVA